MTDQLKIEVVTPQKSVVSDEAQIIMCPGTYGEFGVLKGHTPFLSTLKIGTVRYKDAGGTDRFVFVSGGFAETLPGKVTILAESAERRRDIDIDRARLALERARDRIEKKNTDDTIDFSRAKAALNRALFRIQLAG